MPLGMGSTGTQRNRKVNEFFISKREKISKCFKTSQEVFRGSSLLGKMQLFQVKKLQPVSAEQQPLTKGSLALRAHS